MDEEYGFVGIQYKEDGEIIDTIMMGDGTVQVTSLEFPGENKSGVAFSHAPDNKVVGELMTTQTYDELGVKTQLLFDNPASIDVVIARLREAKESLVASLTPLPGKEDE